MCPDTIQPRRTFSPTPSLGPVLDTEIDVPRHSLGPFPTSDCEYCICFPFPVRFWLLSRATSGLTSCRVGPYILRVSYCLPFPLGRSCYISSIRSRLRRVCASPHGPVVCPGHVPSLMYEIVTVARFPFCSGRTYVYPTLVFESLVRVEL